MKYTILAALLFINLCACEPIDQRTKIFSDYLNKTYGLKIPKPQHTYIAFPKNVGCLGCSAHTFEFVTSHKFKNVTLICNPSQTETLPPNNFYEILTDTFDDIEHLNLQTQNVAIIETKDEKINQIVSIQANTIDSVLNNYFNQKK